MPLNLRRLSAVVHSRSLQSSAVFALGGAAFALGNLFLARRLHPEEYGRFALMVAVVVVSASVAPLGVDQVLLRRDIRVGARFAARMAGPAVLISAAFGVAAHGIYQLPAIEAALLSFATLTVTFMRTAACALRRYGRQIASVAVDTSSDWTILAIGLLALSTPLIPGATMAMACYAVGLLAATALAWIPFQGMERRNRGQREQVSWA